MPSSAEHPGPAVWPDPLAGVLAGDRVRLEPLAGSHRDALFAASRPTEVWRWMRDYPASRAAFDVLGCIRVELKTHAENVRSRRAMEAMGAWFEGVHRNHRIVPGIGIRDTAWFSVIDDDWPAVRARLRARLEAR